MAGRKKPSVRDVMDQEMIDNASQYYAFRYFGRGHRQKLGPFNSIDEAKQAIADAYSRDDLAHMTTNQRLKEFSIYAVTFVHTYPHTTHYFNVGRDHVRHLQRDPGDQQTGTY